MKTHSTERAKKTVARTFEIDDKDILEFVRSKKQYIPADAKMRVFIKIPGGGDWSNKEFDITAEDPIRMIVEWEY